MKELRASHGTNVIFPALCVTICEESDERGVRGRDTTELEGRERRDEDEDEKV